jgi:prepilin-type N-terminal cleavage/methylation domain-containing protein
MTSPGPRSERGFTLLEIMIALAILAVGAICVLSTFAAAIALHLRRESDVRTARVLEEARVEAQDAWDNYKPSKGGTLPPPLKDVTYNRDPNFTYSVTFEPVEGQPVGVDGHVGAIAAVVRITREGESSRGREARIFLARSGIRPEDLKGSLTYETEKKKAEEMKTADPSKRPSDR